MIRLNDRRIKVPTNNYIELNNKIASHCGFEYITWGVDTFVYDASSSWSDLMQVLSEELEKARQGEENRVDPKRYPHRCSCGAPAYVGYSDVDCSAKCGGRG